MSITSVHGLFSSIKGVQENRDQSDKANFFLTTGRPIRSLLQQSVLFGRGQKEYDQVASIALSIRQPVSYNMFTI